MAFTVYSKGQHNATCISKATGGLELEHLSNHRPLRSTWSRVLKCNTVSIFTFHVVLISTIRNVYINVMKTTLLIGREGF